MIEIINKAMPGLFTALSIAVVTAWFTNARQLENNKAAIIKLAEDMDKIEASHTRRLESLEYAREVMPDSYVTRREFNLIVQTLDDKLNKVDKNVEKLLDMQINKN